MTFDTRGSDFDTLLAVYRGSGVSALSVVVSNDDASGGGTYQSEVSFAAQHGVVYHIAVDGYGGATGSIVLNWQAAPDDDSFLDDFLDDFDVTIPSSCSRQVQLCVRDHACQDGDEIRVTVNGNAVFSGALTNAAQCFPVSVREGINSVELLALNGTGYTRGVNGEQCNYSDSNTGEIQISGSTTQQWRHRGGTGSTANLNVTIGPPASSCFTDSQPSTSGADAFSSRIGISGASGRMTGSNVGASKEFGEPNHGGNRGGASVWWSWTAPATGTVTFDTQGSDFDTLLAVYRGSSVERSCRSWPPTTMRLVAARTRAR